MRGFAVRRFRILRLPLEVHGVWGAWAPPGHLSDAGGGGPKLEPKDVGVAPE
jgi:hypothetical protein